jgi:hypothetical protein
MDALSVPVSAAGLTFPAPKATPAPVAGASAVVWLIKAVTLALFATERPATPALVSNPHESQRSLGPSSQA